MANISNEVNVHDGASVTNWISQINAGGTVYDIATHHGITFKDGSADTTGVMWNGLTDIEIVIPSITDIVQTPIEFIGTVSADGKVMDGSKEIITFEKGNLVFVAANCTFDGKVCEAGDMAIYDGSEWKVVTGENQVSIVGNNGEAETTILLGPAKQVLSVEGKVLTLGLDYANLDKHVKVSEKHGGSVDVTFGDASTTVDAINLTLNKTTESVNVDGIEFENAIALADGAVTFSDLDALVTEVNFGELTPGAFPTLGKNIEKTLTVSGGSVVAGTGSDYIASVTLPDIKITKGDESDHDITVLTNISGNKEGQEFLNGIHLTADGETADLTFFGGGYVPASGVNTTFVEGLNEGSEVITSITLASFEGPSEVVTGFDGASTVVTNVSASVSSTTNVLKSATVKDHVLSFADISVATGVSVTPTIEELKLTFADVKYTNGSFTSSTFKTSGFNKVDDVKFTFGKDKETIYTPTSEMYKIATPTLGITRGAYTFVDDDMTALVPAGTFGTGLEGGILPSLSKGTVGRATNNTITGSVKTDLSIENKKTNDVTFNLPSYTLISTATTGDGIVTVGASGEIAVEIEKSTVDLSEYLIGVDVTIENAEQA